MLFKWPNGTKIKKYSIISQKKRNLTKSKKNYKNTKKSNKVNGKAINNTKRGGSWKSLNRLKAIGWIWSRRKHAQVRIDTQSYTRTPAKAINDNIP